MLKFLNKVGFTVVLSGARCLRTVELEIITKDPSTKAAIAGSTVILRCNFELEPDESFDSIRWYRGEANFYDFNKEDVEPKFFKQVYKYEVNVSDIYLSIVAC